VVLLQLKKIGEIISSRVDQSDQNALFETEKLTRRYTMHKERKIHDQFLEPVKDISVENRPEKSKIIKRVSVTTTTGVHEGHRHQNAEKGHVEPDLDQQTYPDDDFEDNVELF